MIGPKSTVCIKEKTETLRRCSLLKDNKSIYDLRLAMTTNPITTTATKAATTGR